MRLQLLYELVRAVNIKMTVVDILRKIIIEIYCQVCLLFYVVKLPSTRFIYKRVNQYFYSSARKTSIKQKITFNRKSNSAVCCQ